MSIIDRSGTWRRRGGATVTFTAAPDAGMTFAGWTGAGCTGTGDCVVSVIGQQTVVALFSGPAAVTFYHLDALGSVRAVTDVSGATVKRHDYFAFGEDPAPMTGDPRRFAGKELDAETALQYFGGRYYRNVTGRLTSVDPVRNVDRCLQDPQQWNRYAYANNNPLRFVDPDGRTFWDVLDFVSAGASVVEFVRNPSWKGAGMALLDVAGAALPVIPSPGTVRRMVQAADAVVGGAKAIAKRADDLADGAKAAVHGNKVDQRPATLYEKYDKDGNFQKHGVTKHEDPSKRYTKKELDGGEARPVERGPRRDMIQKERERVMTNPGPQNREPWAGSGIKK